MAVPYKLSYLEIETGLSPASTFKHAGDFLANRIIKYLGTSDDILLGDGTTASLDSKQNVITLTTVGTTGASTLIGDTLNIPNYADQFVGTVTEVAALTLGTTGTDLNSTVANSTTTPVITLNVPTASATKRGALSSEDWTTFNSKQNAGDYITSLTGEATATGPGAASVTLSNSAVISKVLTGLNVAGGSVASTDSILQAFGKVQNQINGLIGGSIFQGTWNANTNTPTLTSGVGMNGYYYIVNVDGSTNLDGITDWKVGDWAIFAGTTWEKVDNTDAVASVNGYTGTVSLVTGDVSEGAGSLPGRPSQLYFTNARAREAISLTTTGNSGSSSYDNVTGILNVPNYTLSGLGGVPTTRQLTVNGTTYDLSADRSWSVGTVTSVGLTMPVAFSVANSPIESAGTLAVTAVGSATQYIRGDGQLATLPTGAGGGSSVNYYLNGSVDASVAGYKQMDNTAIIGGGTDFNLTGNGLIAQFLTDAGNPNRLQIPGGAWNLEMFFSVSSSGGNAKFYAEVLEYDGTTFTSIATGITNPEEITGGTSIDLYLTSLGVPETALLITDRLAIRVYIVDNSGGRTVTLHTEDNTLCQITTTFAGGISALNGLTANTQYFAVGTSGTDFAVSSLLDTHTFNLPTASSVNRGALSSANWTTFNNKQNAITLTTTGSSGPSTFISDILNVPNYTLNGLNGVPTSRTLTINGTTYDLSANRTWSVGTVTNVSALTLGTGGTDLSSTVANGTTNPVITLNVPTASATNRGVLSTTDWTTFNNKQAAGNYITSLTGEATATGPGAAAVTLNNASVTAKVLTGVNIAGGTVLATDTMLTAFGKLQNQINGLFGGAIYQGTWNASTNTPALTSSVGTKGYYYIVSVAGTTNLNGITDWFVGDWAIFDGTAWQQVDNTDAVVSVNGQIGAVSLTTDNISEGVTNQYFLNSRARASLSFAAGSGAYNSTTGLITIPTNTDQLTNGASYITLASLSGVAPIQYNNGTGAISITQAGTASNGFLSSTDWNTFNNKQPALTNPVTGTGTPNSLARFTSSSIIGDSAVTDNGTTIVLGRTTSTLATATEENSITITQPTINLDKPVKLLNFNWYNEPWSIGNIRSSSAFSNGLGIFATGVEKVRFQTNAIALQQGVNLEFKDNPYIRWSSNFLNFKNVDSSIPVVALRANGNNTQAPRLDMYNTADSTVMISLNAASGTGVFNNSLISTDYRYTGNGYLTYNTDNVGTNTFTLRNNGTSVLGFDASNAATFISSVTAGATSVIGTQLTLNALYSNGITFINTNVGVDNRNFRIISDQSLYGDFQIQRSTTQGGSTYTNLLSFAQSGVATFSSSVRANDIYAQSGTTGGYVSLRSGGAGAAGYMEIYSNNGTTRLGYIGYDTTNLLYSAEGSATHRFEGVATFSSSVTAAQFLASSSSNAAIITSTGTTGYGLVAVGSSGGPRDIFLAGQSGFSNGFTVQYTGTEMKYGFQSGKVGIYTASPKTRLTLGDYVGARLPYINGTGATFNENGITVTSSNTANGNVGGGIDLTNNVRSVGAYSPIISFSSMTTGGTYNNSYAGIWGIYQYDDGNWASGHIAFGTSDPYGIVEKMRLTNGGSLGIGTPTPSNRLTILSADLTSVPTLGTNQGHFGIFNGTGGGSYGLMSGILNNGNAYLQVQRVDGTATAYNLLLQPSGGNVGINKIDPSYKLDVEGGIRTTGNSVIAGTFSFINLENNSSKINCSRFLTIADNGGAVGIGYNSDSIPFGSKFLVNGTSYFNGTLRTNGTLSVYSNASESAKFYGDGGFDGANRMYITNYAYIYGRNNLILTGRLDDGNDGYSFGTNGRNSIVFNVNEGGAQGAVGTEYYSIQLQVVTKGMYFQSAYGSTNGLQGFLFSSDNQFRIRNVNSYGDYALQVTGASYMSGAVTASSFFESSDSRLKEIIKDDYKAVGIESIKPKLYVKNGKEEVGYFAQDFQNLLPTAVNVDEEGMLSLSYTQVHTAKIAIIEDKVTILEREVAELKVKLQKYEA